MDAGIADTINRDDARKVASHLDLIDWLKSDQPWWLGIEAQAFLSNACGSGEKAWLFVALAAGVPGLRFDGHPADCDWDNIFSHFRAEILARRHGVNCPAAYGAGDCVNAHCVTPMDRDPKTPPAQAAETQLGCVV